MKVATNQERLNELFDADPRNDTAIANALGVSKQTVSMWRHGTRSPKKTVLIQIANEFNVSIEWLMGFDVEKDGTSNRKTPIFIPDSKQFVEITKNMSADDYVMVMDAFDRTYKKMKEKGLI